MLKHEEKKWITCASHDDGVSQAIPSKLQITNVWAKSDAKRLLSPHAWLPFDILVALNRKYANEVNATASSGSMYLSITQSTVALF